MRAIFGPACFNILPFPAPSGSTISTYFTNSAKPTRPTSITSMIRQDRVNRATRLGEQPCRTRNTSLSSHAGLSIRPSKSSHPGLPAQSVQPSLKRYSKPRHPSHSIRSRPPGQPSQSSFPIHTSNTCIVLYQFYHFIG